jgi:hypothetical protein
MTVGPACAACVPPMIEQSKIVVSAARVRGDIVLLGRLAATLATPPDAVKGRIDDVRPLRERADVRQG